MRIARGGPRAFLKISGLNDVVEDVRAFAQALREYVFS
jgi:hypothetical protein